MLKAAPCWCNRQSADIIQIQKAFLTCFAMQPSWTAEDAYTAGTAFVASLSKSMVFMRSLRSVRFLQRTNGDIRPLLVQEVCHLSFSVSLQYCNNNLADKIAVGAFPSRSIRMLFKIGIGSIFPGLHRQLSRPHHGFSWCLIVSAFSLFIVR